MAKNEPQDVDTVEDGDAPLIDMNDASIKKMMQRAEKRIVAAEDHALAAEFRAQAAEAQLQTANRELAAIEDMIRKRLV